MTYQERGHSLKTKRGKNDIRLPREETVWTAITKWQQAHMHVMDLKDFNWWWKDVLADFEDDAGGLLEYLESLCGKCLSETTGLKGRKYCPKCKTRIGEYK